MKIIVFGASGIIGSHMRLQTPDGVDPIWMRREADALHRGLDFSGLWSVNLVKFLGEEKPDVIVNLAGESRTDVVEKDPEAYRAINVDLPSLFSIWCDRHHGHYVHVSTQAVFDGEHAPYHPGSPRRAVNAYGQQKIDAEQAVEHAGSRWSIVRPTFVLGVRPVPTMGRENPIEQMLTASVQKQVSDRWFSVSFARDVAAAVWQIALGEPQLKPIHLGIAHGVSRYDLAMAAQTDQKVYPVAHDDAFPGIAPRPRDTTFADGEGLVSWEPRADVGIDIMTPGAAKQLQTAWGRAQTIKDGIAQCRRELQERDSLSVEQRARELSLFTGKTEAYCLAKLQTGFHTLHAQVAEDFRNAVRLPCSQCKGTGAVHGDHDCPSCIGSGISISDCRAPESDSELLDWYRKTDSYLYELTAYHMDIQIPEPGFNYFGMCRGIAERIKTEFPGGTVLCLGDGIGDLSMTIQRAGMQAVYHDLDGTRTAAFAALRWWMYFGTEMRCQLAQGWDTVAPCGYDAIVSLDYLEHCVNVREQVEAVYRTLKPGGLAMFQNAFNCGSGPDGSIPCHLAINDHYEKDWDPMLSEIGFKQIEHSNWYRKSG